MTHAFHAPEDLLTHASFVQRLARSLVADAHAADDVVQETWRAALERGPDRTKGGTRETFRAWLARVARNAAHQRWRGEARRAERERVSARPEAVPEAVSGQGEREAVLASVVTAVLGLDEPYRATILARYYEGLSPGAIARRDGVPLETVHTRLQRALARLRSALERDARDWRRALLPFGMGGGGGGGGSVLAPGAGGALLALGKVPAVLLAGGVVLAGLAAWGVLRSSGARPAGASGEVTLASAEPLAGPRDPPAEPGARAALTVPQGPQDSQTSGAVLSGRVVDESGAPVAGAPVHVLGDEDPFGPEHPAPRVGVDYWHGRTFPSDAEGRWSAELPGPARVLVALGYQPSYEHGEAGERWVEAPAAGIDFVVRRVPTGVIEVRVFEGASRRPVAGFSGSIRGNPEYVPEPGQPAVYTGGYYSMGARDGLARQELSVDDPAGRPLRVTLSEPACEPLLSQVVLLQPGATLEVVFVIPERGVLRGFVVDPAGAPIEGALVFFGDQTRARGDEPFRPLREERIGDGARTGRDGWYELRGDGTEVSAAHASFTPATVPVAAAGRIALAPRGALRGRFLDGEGRPLAGAVLWLDQRERGPQATTDADGRFAFERVEGGAHALWADDLLLALRLAPGEEADVEVRAPTPGALELELRSAGTPLDVHELEGLIAGLDRRFGIYEIEHWRPATSDPRELETGFVSREALVRQPSPELVTIQRRVEPGRYWLVTGQGLAAAFTVEEGAPRAVVEIGSSELVVRSSRRANVQVVPADADAFTRLMAARAWMLAEAEVEARFRLHPGRYLLVGEAGVILRAVDLPPEGAEITLD